jgi:hypothetical protein
MVRLVALAALGSTVLTARASANLLINVTYDSSVTSQLTALDAGTLETAFNAVASGFDAAITNNITVNIDVSVGRVSPSVALPTGSVSGSYDTKTSMGSTPRRSPTPRPRCRASA